MIGRTNVGGSGGAKAFAVISVIYPAGSVCTCTDGTKTLKLKNTSGHGLFLIPYAATWAVRCFDGADYDSSGQKTSQNVEITTEGQSESVILSYTLWVFKSGNGALVEYYAGSGSLASISVGTEKISMNFSGNTGPVESAFRCKEKYDISTYTKLCIEYVYLRRLSDLYYMHVMVNPNAFVWDNGYSSEAVADGEPEISETKQIFTLNISSLSGPYYVGVRGIQEASIYNMWLE